MSWSRAVDRSSASVLVNLLKMLFAVLEGRFQESLLLLEVANLCLDRLTFFCKPRLDIRWRARYEPFIAH